MKRLLLIITAVALSLALVGCSQAPPVGPQTPPATPPPTTTSSESGMSGQVPPTTPPESGSPDQAPPTTFDQSKVYPAGVYEVGVDIPEGEFRVTSNDYIRSTATVYADAARSSIVYVKDTPRYYYVTVANDQVLEVTDGDFTLASSYAYESQTTIYEGMHRVGSDCPAGTYQLIHVGGGEGFYCIYDGSGPDAKVIKTESGDFPDKTNVTVSAGQYLELKGVTGLLT